MIVGIVGLIISGAAISICDRFEFLWWANVACLLLNLSLIAADLMGCL